MNGLFRVLVILIVFSALPAYAAVTFGSNSTVRLSNGLVGYWTFDGSKMTATTAGDSSGSSRTGVLSSAIPRVPGKTGQALNFNGTSHNISLGNIYNFSARAPFSISAWVNMPTGGGGTVAGKFNGGVTGQWIFSVTAGGAMGFHREVNPFDISSTGPSVTANAWHMVTVTFDGTTSRFYLDGLPNSSNATLGGSVSSNSVTVLLGARFTSGSPSNFFKGKLDEVRVYSRAISAEEVQQLYKLSAATVVTGSKASTTPTTGLVAHYPMDASDIGSNGVVFDRENQGGTKDDGTLVGGVTKVTGQIGQALNFNGSTGAVDISSSGKNHAPTDAPFTVVAWFKTTATPTAFGRILTLKSNSSPMHLMYSTSAARNLSIGGDGWGAVWKVPLPLANQWHHVAVAYNGGGVTTASNFLVVVDGAVQSLTSASTIGAVTNASRIGDYSGAAANEHFAGLIDEVRIYSRALSAKEIADLFSQPKSQTINANDTNRLTNGLVLNQTFNGTDMTATAALDRSGAGNNGTLTSGPVKFPGKVGQALKFDGTDDLVTSANGTLGTLTHDFSVSAWINTTQITGNQRIVGHSRTATANGFSFGLENDKVMLTTFGVKDYVPATGSILPGKWYHVAVVLDSADDASLYVNGALVEKVLHNAPGNSNSDDPLYIGATTEAGIATPSQLFSGLIDEVRVYNKSLSATEIQALYKLGQ